MALLRPKGKLLVLVLGDPEDPSLRLLSDAPPGVRFSVAREARSLARLAPEAKVIFCSAAEPSELAELLKLSPRVRWIHTRSAGLDNSLNPTLVESEATLTNSKGVYSAALGEFVLGAILFFAKDLRRMLRSQEAARWEAFDLDMLQNATLGIVGYGDIGRAIAERGRAFGMRVLALARSPRAGRDPMVDEFFTGERLVDLMARSDYVAVSLPLTPETRGFVGKPSISAMKTTAVLVNVGRGDLVDEEALVSALEERRIRGAALDVFKTEPLPQDHAFYRLENVLLSPHSADHTRSWRQDAVRLFLLNLELFREGAPLRNVVEKARGY